MRCLWVTRQDPFPANSGELIYSGGLARALSEAGAEITLVCHQASAESPLPKRPLPKLLTVVTTGSMPNRTLRNFLSPLPSDADRLRSKSLESEVRQQIHTGQFDAVIVDHAALGWASDLIPQNSTTKPKLVYVSHNCEAVIRKQIAEHCADGFLKQTLMNRDARKYARLEQRLCDAADLITAITPEDRETYAQEYPQQRVIDLMPGYESPEVTERDRPIDQNLPRRVLMVGSFEWIAKRHNLEETLDIADPIFTREGIEFEVVGKADPAYAADIERRYQCVRFHPNVPEVTPYLQQARIGLIAETVGGGFKLKTLEYAFNRLPMAALENALGGLKLDNNRDAIVEPTLASLIASIAQKIDDFEFLNSASARTLTKFSQQFRWQDRGDAFLNAIHQLHK